MKIRTILLLALALICGVSAAIGVNQLRQPAEVGEVQTVPVVTMSASLSRGVLVTDSTDRVEHWPESLTPPGVIQNLEDVIGRAALTKEGQVHNQGEAVVVLVRIVTRVCGPLCQVAVASCASPEPEAEGGPDSARRMDLYMPFQD